MDYSLVAVGVTNPKKEYYIHIPLRVAFIKYHSISGSIYIQWLFYHNNIRLIRYFYFLDNSDFEIPIRMEIYFQIHEMEKKYPNWYSRDLILLKILKYDWVW